jgi:hypothetical protein
VHHVQNYYYFYYYDDHHHYRPYVGYVVLQLLEALPYKPEGREFDPRWGHLQSWPHYGPEVDPGSNRSKYRGYVLG